MSVMKKAKMSTDKALLKEVIQNLSVELQPETAGEFTLEHFKTEVDKAGGARYAGNSTAENKHSLFFFASPPLPLPLVSHSLLYSP